MVACRRWPASGIGTDATVAIGADDISLMGSGLAGVKVAVGVSRDPRVRAIRENLLWAFGLCGQNVAFTPVATAGGERDGSSAFPYRPKLSSDWSRAW